MFGAFLIACLIMSGITLYEWWKKTPSDKAMLRVDLGAISKFLAIMSLVTVMRLCGADFLMEVIPGEFSEIIYKIKHTLTQVPLWRLSLVFWEDAFFALPMVYVIGKYSRWIWIPFVITMSIMFGIAHGYQGEWAIWTMALYPYFISYRLGIKHGFGTVMACHILYDIITYLTLHGIIYFMG